VAAQYAAQGNFLGSSDSWEQVIQNSLTPGQTNSIVSIADNPDGTFTITFVGTPQTQYYVVTSLDPLALMSSWDVLPNSTNTAPPPDGVWSVTVTNDAAQRFYRSAAITPAQ
jgi:hypothetical protein